MKKPIIPTIILIIVQFLAPVFGQIEQKPRLVVQTGHASLVGSVAFNPNGKILASGSWDNTVKLWDVKTGREIRTFVGHSARVMSVAFNKEGNILASGSGDNTIKLWSVKTGEVLRSLKGHASWVRCVVFSSDTKIIASASDDKSIKIWNVENGNQLRTILSPFPFSYFNSLDFSPDGRTLVSGNSDSSITLWDSRTGKKLKTLFGHSNEINSVKFSLNGEFLASGSSDKTIKLWNVRSGKELYTLVGHSSRIWSIAFSSDGKMIASAGDDQTVRVWDTTNSKIIQVFSGHSTTICTVAFNIDGKLIASGSEDSVIKFWDIESRKEIRTLSKHSMSGPVAFSKDGKILAIGNHNSIKILDLETGKILRTLNGHTSFVSSLSFNDDGKTLASGSWDNTIKIWDFENGKEIKNINAHSDNVYSVTFSPDGMRLASGSGDKTIKIWDVKTGKELKTLIGHSRLVMSVTFSKDGTTLASGSFDRTIKLWSADNGKELKTLVGHPDDIYSVEFSDDCKKLASGSDNYVKIWGVETGKELESIDNFSPDSRQKIAELFPSLYAEAVSDKFITEKNEGGKIKLFDRYKWKELLTFIILDENDWVVISPEQRFDTDKIENPQGLHWILPDAPFTPLSFEVFMRDYYEPNLLPRLLKCNEENNCEQEFKPIRNLTELNRTQPKIKISDIKATAAADIVQVTVEAEDAASEYQKDKQNKTLRSGVSDLRLFRDGQLVGYAPDGDGAVGLDKNGKFTKTFAVRLPKNRDLKEVNFTAYAFNFDRVKSETAQKTYTLPKPLPTAKGSAFIVAIGVNANETASYNLRYAANDARLLQSELVRNLPQDRYEKIVQIPLVSDFDDVGKLSENNATKAKIKAVLDRLAGKTVADDSLKNVPNRDLLKKVQPEDLVLIAFSGHGYADREGIFYLIPYDIGKSAGSGLKNVLDKSVSSDELSLWLRDVDAGEMMMIVDACHSAAAVQGKDFKPGPMGSRGLGQLSYDKGMRILTATQADNVALELGNLQHGLLTYSLVKNGIELGLADYQPKDNKLFSSEWLSFAVKDVPLLYEKAAKGDLKNLFVDGKPKSDVIFLDNQKSNLNLQQPSLFDFSRRDRQYELVDLALKNVPESK